MEDTLQLALRGLKLICEGEFDWEAETGSQVWKTDRRGDVGGRASPDCAGVWAVSGWTEESTQPQDVPNDAEELLRLALRATLVTSVRVSSTYGCSAKPTCRTQGISSSTVLDDLEAIAAEKGGMRRRVAAGNSWIDVAQGLPGLVRRADSSRVARCALHSTGRRPT